MAVDLFFLDWTGHEVPILNVTHHGTMVDLRTARHWRLESILQGFSRRRGAGQSGRRCTTLQGSAVRRFDKTCNSSTRRHSTKSSFPVFAKCLTLEGAEREQCKDRRRNLQFRTQVEDSDCETEGDVQVCQLWGARTRVSRVSQATTCEVLGAIILHTYCSEGRYYGCRQSRRARSRR